MEDIKLKAEQALKKQSSFDEEVNLDQYRDKAESHAYIEDLQSLPEQERRDMLLAGVDASEEGRAGTYVQHDHSVIHTSIFQEGLEVLDINEALKKYDWLRDYYWKALPVDKDLYTASTELKESKGFFIRALPGVKAIFPIQACMYMGVEGLLQSVHNIIIAEEGSDLHVITGCTTAHGIRSGMHIGVTETYVKKNARVTSTMVHNWGKEVVVRPRSATVVEEGGTFLSNYIQMNPVKSVQMNPVTYLNGRDSVARFHSILMAQPGTRLDIGSVVYLRGINSRAEIISRSLTRGGEIINRGHLVGEVEGVKGHLECHGLMLSKNGLILAIPELEARVDGVDLSHEAAVGKIAQEEIEYLMARGLSEEEAAATIVRGFLNVRIMGLPAELEAEVQRAIELSEQSGI